MEFFSQFLVLYEFLSRRPEVQDFLQGKTSYYNVAIPRPEPSALALKYLDAFSANEVQFSPRRIRR